MPSVTVLMFSRVSEVNDRPIALPNVQVEMFLDPN